MKPEEINNQLNKENVKEQNLSANDEYVLSEWQAPKNKTGFIIFLISTIFFLAFGIVFLVLNQQINEYSYRYDTVCGNMTTCTVTLPTDANLEPPIYFYYELNNYFQNHRVYLESRDDDQLYGTWKTVDQLSSCNPIIKNSDLLGSGFIFDTLLNGNKIQDYPNDPATPCGLIAQTFFTDTYTMSRINDNKTLTSVTINETGISWKYDRDNFKNTGGNAENNHTGHQWIDLENEHFQVWMRAAGLSKFKKLWGRITDSMPAGNYNVTISNTYDVTKYDAKKYFVITTVNALGGKNTVLVYSYMITGGICFLLTIIFLVGWIREKKYKKP